MYLQETVDWFFCNGLYWLFSPPPSPRLSRLCNQVLLLRSEEINGPRIIILKGRVIPSFSSWSFGYMTDLKQLQ